MADRSSRAEVRNPVLALPGIATLMDLPAPMREAFAVVLMDLSVSAAEKAQSSWRRNKGPMAVYWKAVSVYAKHIARALRRPAKLKPTSEE